MPCSVPLVFSLFTARKPAINALRRFRYVPIYDQSAAKNLYSLVQSRTGTGCACVPASYSIHGPNISGCGSLSHQAPCSTVRCTPTLHSALHTNLTNPAEYLDADFKVQLYLLPAFLTNALGWLSRSHESLHNQAVGSWEQHHCVDCFGTVACFLWFVVQLQI